MSNETFRLEEYDEAAAYLRAQMHHRPTVGLVLGSGLSVLAEQIEDAVTIPYAEIPHFPVSTVEGHAGRLVVGTLAGQTVAALQGRFHYYEGYSMQHVTLPVRVLERLGVRTLLLTNAAGGLNPTFAVGDLMVIEDHINFLGMAGANPLRGPNLREFGPRFPAANRIYTRRLRELAFEVAAQEQIALQHGVYVALAGPNFESPAEVRMLRAWGGDAVGMSTAPEAQVAHHAGMELLAVSTITNVALSELDVEGEPSHEEVMQAGQVIVPRLTALLLGVLRRLAVPPPPLQVESRA